MELGMIYSLKMVSDLIVFMHLGKLSSADNWLFAVFLLMNSLLSISVTY
tara:strand:- start:344 stop:490 length:147 start_codon:yes stop_codon:yes gene_type:complete